MSVLQRAVFIMMLFMQNKLMKMMIILADLSFLNEVIV